MAITIISPQFSFVQFSESSIVTSCNFRDVNFCLPVYESNDVAFQFIAQTDTEEEADALCNLTNSAIQIGLVNSCNQDYLLEFGTKPDRFRIGVRQVLYNWTDGFPGFEAIINIGECFLVKVIIDDTYEFCSNCFQRIADPCHTSVIEYGNDDNGFGFNYCNSEGTEIDDTACDPTFIGFTNDETLVIPYTASLLAKYGTLPNVQVWIYDGLELVDMGIRAAFDTYPPTEIRFDFGGAASGVIKIS